MPNTVTRNIYFKLQGHINATESLKSKRAYSQSAQRLCARIRNAIIEMQKNVLQLNPGSLHAEKIAARYSDCADYFHCLLGFIEASQAGRVPQAMIAPLEDMIRRPMEKAELIVSYDWLPSNYSFQRRLPGNLRRKLESIFDNPEHPDVKSIPNVLAILSFPAAERENVLLHSALAHEVGHALSEAFNSVAECAKFCRINEESLIQLADAEAAKIGQAADMFLVKNLREKTVLVLADWLDELIADTWSVCLMGPAPLIALHSLDPIQYASNDHPPGFLRFKLMIQCLNHMGFSNLAKQQSHKWLNDILYKIESDSGYSDVTEENAPEYQLVFDTLKNAQTKIADHVLIKAENCDLYDSKKWSKDVKKNEITKEDQHILVDRLLNYIPPDCLAGEIGDDLIPSDLASIMNAGWAVYLGYWSKFCEGISANTLPLQYEAWTRFNRLLLKGIELSYLIQQKTSKK